MRLTDAVIMMKMAKVIYGVTNIIRNRNVFGHLDPDKVAVCWTGGSRSVSQSYQNDTSCGQLRVSLADQYEFSAHLND